MTTTTTRAKRKPRDLTELVSLDLRKAAASSRRRVLGLIEQLYEQRPEWHHERGRRKVIRELTDHYLKAITAIREAVSVDELERLQQTLTNRLETGWELEPTDARDQLFARLLTDYEIVTDALADSVLSPYLERLETLEARCQA